jgi:hypothetical protein
MNKEVKTFRDAWVRKCCDWSFGNNKIILGKLEAASIADQLQSLAKWYLVFTKPQVEDTISATMSANQNDDSVDKDEEILNNNLRMLKVKMHEARSQDLRSSIGVCLLLLLKSNQP